MLPGEIVAWFSCFVRFMSGGHGNMLYVNHKYTVWALARGTCGSFKKVALVGIQAG